ncbi:MAG: M17 family peptidase N-terminal domain-containing protein [Candidatus Sulfotelmatobacter sp.]
MTTLKQVRHLAVIYAILFAALTAHSQPRPTQLEVLNAPIPTYVLVQSPADTQTALQVICLFQSDPANTLHGSLLEINQKLAGLLDQIRKPTRFAGSLGETLLITPAGKMSAKQLLIVGLGDAKSYTPERMDLVGAIVYREANRLGIEHPFFAPTVLDGGVTGFSTGDTAAWFIRGFLRAAATEKQLASAGDSAGVTIRALTFLAGAAHATDTRDGLAKAYATSTAK